MSIDFVHSVTVLRPSDVVFDYVSDFENNPTWQQGMVMCRWTSPTRREVGSTYDQEARFFGRPILTSFVVTAFTPGHSISIESTRSTIPLQITRTVEPAGDHACKVSAHVRGQPTGLLRLFSPMVPRSVAKDYARLVQQLEGA